LQVAAGSALVFLALNAFLYGYRTGLLFELSAGELVEIAIKIYCLGVGTFLIADGHARHDAASFEA
jgi:hypothetical protein